MSCDCDHYDLFARRHVEDVERKRTEYLRAYIARDRRAALGMLAECAHGGLNVLNELVAEARHLFIEIRHLFFEFVSSFGENLYAFTASSSGPLPAPGRRRTRWSCRREGLRT